MNLYALFFGLALFGFCSCDNDDSVTPDPQARQAFESKYPNATQVEWEKKNNYLIAEFIDNQLDGKAWFDATGTEVKSIRGGQLNLKDSYCAVTKEGELMVYNMHISPYDKGNIFNRDPDRPKRLLMHKREIRKLHEAQKLDGYALIPLSVYFKNGLVKVELGVCKGKKNYDKRQAIAERDAKREMDRARRERY